MQVDTEGVVIRQVKAGDGRRMILLFTRRFGKISAGTSINERGKNKNALAIRPFTFGYYNLFKTRSSYNINSAETKKSFYKLGEDVDKFMLASYILEYTDKLLPEEEPNEHIFDLLITFMKLLEQRKKKIETLSSGYQVRALKYSGLLPNLESCSSCGKKLLRGSGESTSDKLAFSIKSGGLICSECLAKPEHAHEKPLIYWIDFAIVDILKFFSTNTLEKLENVGLDENSQERINGLLEAYSKYHLGIESFKTKTI